MLIIQRLKAFKQNRYWAYKLFALLFIVSMSTTIIPCDIVCSYGLFGEVKASIITKEHSEEVSEISDRKVQSVKQIKGINIFNPWLFIIVLIILIRFVIYRYSLPRGDTIITRKVRIND